MPGGFNLGLTTGDKGQPRNPITSTSPLHHHRGREKMKIRYIDQSRIPISEAKSIRLNEAISGRVSCPVTLNGLNLSCIFDSGNTFRTVGSLKLMQKLGLTEDDLQPISQKQVGSAALKSSLTILGETKTPMMLQLDNTDRKYKFRLVFLKELDHEINLGLKFLKAIGASWDFPKDALLFKGQIIPLRDDQGEINPFWKGRNLTDTSGFLPLGSKINKMFLPREHAPERVVDPEPVGQAVLAEDHVLQPGRPSIMKLKVRDQIHGIEIGQNLIVESHRHGPNCLYRLDRPIIGAVNVVAQLNSEKQLYSEALNTSTKVIKLRRGTPFGSIFEAEHVFEPDSTEKNVEQIAKIQRMSQRNHDQEDLVPSQHTQGDLQEELEQVQLPAYSSQPLDVGKLSEKQRQFMSKQIRSKLQLEKSPFCQADPEVEKQLMHLLLRYYFTFSWDGSPGKTSLVQHSIITSDDIPIKEPYR